MLRVVTLKSLTTECYGLGNSFAVVCTVEFMDARLPGKWGTPIKQPLLEHRTLLRMLTRWAASWTQSWFSAQTAHFPNTFSTVAVSKLIHFGFCKHCILYWKKKFVP